MEIVSLILSALACILLVIVLATRPRGGDEQQTEQLMQELEQSRQQMQNELRQMRGELGNSIHRAMQTSAELQASAQRQISETQNARIT